MREDTSFIKIFRKFTEWEWYDDNNIKVLFLHLLLTANYKPSRYRGHVVPAGALVTGRKALAARLGMTEQNVRTVLKKLKSTNEVTIKSTNEFSIISIVKWESYQERQPTQQPTTNQRLTNDQPTPNQRLTTSKEGKKERIKKKETKKKNLPSFVSEQTWADILDHRKKIKKPMSDRAESNMLKNLEDINDAGVDVEVAVDLMVDKGWSTITLEWFRNSTQSPEPAARPKLKVLN